MRFWLKISVYCLFIHFTKCQRENITKKESNAPLKVYKTSPNWQLRGVSPSKINESEFWFWGNKNISDRPSSLVGSKISIDLNEIPLNIEGDIIIYDLKTLGNNFAFAGSVNFNGNKAYESDAFVGISDFSGNIIWWDTLQGNYNNHYNSLCIINDTLMAVSGSKQTSIKGFKPIISCYRNDGKKIWSKNIEGFSIEEKGISITALKNDEVLLTKSVSTGSTGNLIYAALNSYSIIDGSAGSINLDLNKYATFKGWNSYFYQSPELWNIQTRISPNGDILLFGQRLLDQSFDNPKAHIFGICINQSGFLKWEKEYGFLYNQSYLNDFFTEDSSVISISYLEENRIRNDLLKVDELGLPIEQIKLDLGSESFSAIPLKITPTSRGYSLIGSLINEQSGEKNIFTSILNSKGELIQ